MIYTRLEYAILLAVAWVLYMVYRGRSWRLYLLGFVSLFFYGWAGAFDFTVFIAVIGFAYGCTWMATKYPHYKRSFITAGVVVLTLHLLLWKYLPWAGRGMNLEIWLPLPLGISFFTLQGIGYLLDFKRGKSERMTLPQFVLFKSFFPQLIAGPIVRASDMWGFLRNFPSPRIEQAVEGLFLIGIGLVKKVIIADFLGVFADGIFAAPDELDRATLMLGAVVFYIQIWGDFSGYTDMGRGSALLFGLRLPENFYSTLYANGGTDWSLRWHATLQTWVRDYIFFPLTYSLRKFRPIWIHRSRYELMTRILSRYLCVMIVALWHGAAFNFVIWGFALMVIASVEAVMDKLGLIPRFPSVSRRIFNIVAMLPVFFVTGIFFRCTSLESLHDYLVGLFGPERDTISFIEYAHPVYWRVALAFAIDGVMYYSLIDKRYVFLHPLSKPVQRLAGRYPVLVYGLAGAVAAAIIVLALAFRSNDNLTGFIYFRF